MEQQTEEPLFTRAEKYGLGILFAVCLDAIVQGPYNSIAGWFFSMLYAVFVVLIEPHL